MKNIKNISYTKSDLKKSFEAGYKLADDIHFNDEYAGHSNKRNLTYSGFISWFNKSFKKHITYYGL